MIFPRSVPVSQSFLVMLFNAFGLWIIFKTKKRIRNQDYSSKRFSINQLLILALFCAHFAVGFSRFCYHLTMSCIGYTLLARIFELGLILFVAIELIYTTFIPIERYFTIRFPFHSSAHEKLYRKFYLGIAPMTLLVLVGGLMYPFGFIIPVSSNVLGIIAILVCNFLLFRIVRKQTKMYTLQLQLFS